MNTKLNSKANTSHNHSASNITSGILPVARGGTGVTTLNALKAVLGINSGSISYITGTYNGSHSSTSSRFGASYPQTISLNGTPLAIWIGNYTYNSSQEQMQFGLLLNFNQIFPDDRTSNICMYGVGLFSESGIDVIVPLFGTVAASNVSFWGLTIIKCDGTVSVGKSPKYQFASNFYTYQYAALVLV